MKDLQRFRARYIFPVDRPPLEDATLEIEGDRIVALHDRHDPGAIDLGHVALIPGLVNAHAHLEFSDLDAPIAPPRPMTQWLRSLIRNRSTRTVALDESLTRGVRELIAQGTAVVGEIATGNWSAQAISAANTSSPPLHLVAFRELITLSKDRIPTQLDRLEQHLLDCETASTIQPAVSPHAPYSVHPELFSSAIESAKQHHLPVAIHLAETAAELELLETGKGEFREFLQERGVWYDAIFDTPRTPLDFMKALTELEQALIVHGNYLNGADVDFLAAHPNLTVIYCPRTHAYFGHPPHSWKQLLARGASLALGTDGRSSNPDLSLWNDMCFLQAHHPDVSPVTLLQLGTLNGAKALGVERDYGSITPGKKASIAVIALPDDEPSSSEKLFSPKSLMRGLLDLRLR